jgi:Na+/H+ antiporter NhaD/arsenite permease-like protein
MSSPAFSSPTMMGIIATVKGMLSTTALRTAATHIGATANIIAVTESEKTGDPRGRITPVAWLRVGIPTMVVSLVLASAVYAMFFDYFLG